MKFKFPYQKIMEHKELLKEVAERDWVEARGIYDSEVMALNSMKREVTAAWTRAAQAKSSGGAAGPELAQIDLFLKGQEVRMAQQKEKINAAGQVMEDKHDRFVEAAREYRIFEKLKEKMFSRHKLQLRRLDAKLTDEIVVTRAKRGMEDEYK